MAQRDSANSDTANDALDFLKKLQREHFEYMMKFKGEWLPVREARGVEHLSTPFRFELTVRKEMATALVPQDFSGQPGELLIRRAGRVFRRFYGVYSEATLSATATGTPEFRSVFEPLLANLRHRKDCRIFRDRTVPQIVEEMLSEVQVGVISRLRETYKIRPYTVQWNETDFDFVHRLLEDEGIFYAFPNHQEEPKEALLANSVILADGVHAYEPLFGDDKLALRSTGSLESTEESVVDLRVKAAMGPSKVTLRDWNLERPSADMDASARGPSPSSVEFYDYPGGYEVPDEGARRAKLIAESFSCQAFGYSARSDTARLVPSHTIELVTDPTFSSGFDGRFVVIGQSHHYRFATDKNSDGGPTLEVMFDMLDADTTFRPARVTPKPRISSPLTGFVTGPAGTDDIYTDAYGRVKVHFPWDRYQPSNETCSDWIPVLQDNTGQSSSIPRIGWEVAVAFVEGDPDRPIVLGRVYNGTDPFPEALPAGKMKSALRSLSSPTRDGYNEIWMDDTAGKELVSIQAEKDKNVVVAKDKTEDVGTTEANTIVRNEVVEIGANNTQTVTAKKLLGVDGDQSISVLGNRTRKVGTAEAVTVQGSRATTIGGMHFRKIGGFDNAAAKSGISESVGGVAVEASLKDNKSNAEMLQTLTVGGAVVEVAGQGKSEKTEMLRMETIGVRLVSKLADKFVLDVGAKRSTTIGTELIATAKKTIKVVADKALKAMTTKTDINGAEGLIIQAAGSKVIFDKEGIMFESDKQIEFVATAGNEMASPKVVLNE